MAEGYDASGEVSPWWLDEVKELGLHPVWARLGEFFEDANHHGAWSELTQRWPDGIESWAEQIEREIRADERDNIMERAVGG